MIPQMSPITWVIFPFMVFSFLLMKVITLPEEEYVNFMMKDEKSGISGFSLLW